MTSQTPPVLPILTARTRFYDNSARHPTLTIRQRYIPYPSRCDGLPAPLSSPFWPIFPGAFPTSVQSVVPDLALVPTLEPSDEISQNHDLANEKTTESTKKDDRLLKENDGLILKPNGEAGRYVGGYNLESKLQWQESDFKNMKVCFFFQLLSITYGLQDFVHKLAAKHLNTGECYAKQSKLAIEVISDAVSED
jgi:hypothetical protein